MEDFEYLSINSVSRISIIQSTTKFQLSLVTIMSFWNRCSFDPKCKQTYTQPIFFHMTLLTVEGTIEHDDCSHRNEQVNIRSKSSNSFFFSFSKRKEKN